MSIIVVQLDGDTEATAYVSYGEQVPGGKQVRKEITLPQMDEATDLDMWAQMAAARACDAL
jgi:hypothetical protein